MAKYLLYLLLLLNLLGTNNVQASCYASQWNPTGPVLSSIYGNNGSTLAYCQSLACQIYPNIQGCPGTQAPPPATCTSSFTERTEACPPNHSGIKKFKQETKTCTDGQTTVFPWQNYANTCVQDPPRCQIQNQTQTLSCQTGYTGSITQTQTSLCSDPYGSPVPGPWVTTSNTCTAIPNMTQVVTAAMTNPVSPLNPNSPIFKSPTVASPSPAQQPPVDLLPASQSDTNANTTTTVVATAPTSASSSNLNSSPPPKGKINVAGLGLALSLELLSKKGIHQPNLFPTMDFGQPIPKEILLNDQTMMSLLQVVPLTQEPLKEDLDLSQ